MKKIYLIPEIDLINIISDNILAAGSPSDTLNPDDDNQEITPVDDPYNGEFTSKRGYSAWDEDFEEED